MSMEKQFKIVGVKSLMEFIAVPPEIEGDITGAMCSVIEVDHGEDKWLFMRGTGMMLDYYRLPVMFGFKYSAWKDLWSKDVKAMEQAELAEGIVCIPELFYAGDTFRNNLALMLSTSEVGFETEDVEALYTALRNLPAGTDIEVHWSDIYVKGRHIFQYTKEEGTAVDTLCSTLVGDGCDIYGIGCGVSLTEARVYDYYLVKEETVKGILGDIGYVSEDVLTSVLQCAADYNIIKQEPNGSVWYKMSEIASLFPADELHVWAMKGDVVHKEMAELPKGTFLLINRDILNSWSELFEVFEENKGLEFRKYREETEKSE